MKILLLLLLIGCATIRTPEQQVKDCYMDLIYRFEETNDKALEICNNIYGEKK